MESDNIRDKLKKQRERWLRERDIDKEKKGIVNLSGYPNSLFLEVVEEMKQGNP